jgi:hypothetical protein
LHPKVRPNHSVLVPFSPSSPPHTPPPGFAVSARTGTRLHPVLNSWSLTSDESVNYFITGRRAG